MPKYPIYIDLLPEEAVAVIGRVHEQTTPALAMLESQGFVRTDQIDIFDGGPVVKCATQSIAAVQASSQYPVSQESGLGTWRDYPAGQFYAKAIVTTSRSPFVAVQCDIVILDNRVWMERFVMNALKVQGDDTVWVMKQ